MSSPAGVPFVLSVGAALLVALLWSLLPRAALATDFDLSGECPGGTGDVAALAATIGLANINGLTDTITLAAACVYTLTEVTDDDATYGLSGLPAVVGPLTIEGNGATLLRDPAAPDFRFLLSQADPLTLKHLNFVGGKASGSVFKGAGGVVLALAGALVIEESTFFSNSAAFAGGAVAARSGTVLEIAGTTFANNGVFGSGAGGGGAVASEATTMIVNSTFSGNRNTSLVDGSALYSGFGAKTTLGHSTFTANDSPGPAIKATGPITVTNTLVANQASGTNCKFDDYTSNRYNLSDDDSCGEGFIVVAPSQVRLGPLAYNGGSNLTHTLLSASAAINAGDPAFTPPPDFDQRGINYPRVLSGRIDIGAVEVPAYSIGGTVQGLAGDAVVLRLNGSFPLTVTASGAFTFTPFFLTGNGYEVEVIHQPNNLVQTCTVADGAGTVAFANVTNIVVDCAPAFVEFIFFVDGNGIGFVSCSPVSTATPNSGTPTGTRGGEGCDDGYPVGSVIDVLATPWLASNFAGWSGDCAGEQTPHCTLEMSETRSITATFTTNQGFLPINRRE